MKISVKEIPHYKAYLNGHFIDNVLPYFKEAFEAGIKFGHELGYSRCYQDTVFDTPKGSAQCPTIEWVDE